MFNAMEGAEHLTNAFQQGMQNLIAGIEEKKAFERLDAQRRINAYYQYGLAKEVQIQDLLKIINDYADNHNARWDDIARREKELEKARNELIKANNILNDKIDEYNKANQNNRNNEAILRENLKKAEERIDSLKDMLERHSVDKMATLQMLETMSLIANYYSALNGQNIIPPDHMYKAINEYWNEFEKTGKAPTDNYIILLSQHIKAQNLEEKTAILVKENNKNAALQNQEIKPKVSP